MYNDIKWNDIEECGRTKRGKPKKVYLKNLLTIKGRGRNHDKTIIDWKNSVGRTVPMLYDDVVYNVTIDGYETKGSYLIINIIGYHKIDFKIHVTNFLKCGIGNLISNIYANPNSPNRDLIIDSVGEEVAKTLTRTTHKTIEIMCPNCGRGQNIAICNLTNRGFSCNLCGDGFTYPERLMRETLIVLGAEFEMQTSFDNGAHRYDFFLPEQNAIIEVHGIQHYEEATLGRTLDKEQANDRYKRELAIKNGIRAKDYHEIDCRFSELNHCKHGFISVLGKYFDIEALTSEDWNEIETNAQSSKVVEVCNFFNGHGGTAHSVARALNMSVSTVKVYLRKGSELGICSYSGETYLNDKRKRVVQLNKETLQPVCEPHNSACDAAKACGGIQSGISSCCNGKRKSYKGYIWKWESEYSSLINS